MPDELISQLFDFGALGVFAGFLIWQHLGMQKRLDKLVTNFQTQLKEIDDGFEGRVETMRERYEIVITNLRAECKAERDEVALQRDKLQEQLAAVHGGAEAKLDAVLRELERRNP
jgi:small-conductance mechanosensitive channel